ncbi:unnamed protein product [Periconia digitata]|uniref:Uncharacterized protein n=1 Tax=Periconia digitata TaxID=1303443 RepID=A0A9W4UGS9_9PLEO|nr:unnamed protein product [Periconia digitata]
MFRLPPLLLVGLIGLLVPVKSATECGYEGGWALRVDDTTCPKDAPVNCGTGEQLRCCPNGLKCAGEGDYGGNYCCKEGEDCRSESSSTPQCPDQSWTLFGGNGTLEKGGWCCEPGTNGYYRGNMDAVGCTAAGVRTLPTRLSFASTIATNACVPPTSTASSTPASTSSTPTSTPSQSNEPPSPSPSSSSAGMPGAQIGGIVGGVVGGLALIGAIVGFILFRRKRQSQSPAEVGKDHSEMPSEKNADRYGYYAQPDAQAAAYELPPNDRQVRHELSNGDTPKPPPPAAPQEMP